MFDNANAALSEQPAKPQRSGTTSRRVSYVHNPHPEFQRSEHHKQHKPKFITRCLNAVSRRDVCAWSGWYLLKTRHGRRRHFNVHCRRALNAMTYAMVYYLNRVTWQVETSIDTLTRACGLDTRSAAGNHSVTRGTRRIQLLETYGLISCKKIFDPKSGTWIFKEIVVTELFWDLIGVPLEDAIRVRDEAFVKLQNDRLTQGEITPAEFGRMTRTEYSHYRRQLVVDRAFRYRYNKKLSKQQIKQAKRRAALSQDELRRELAAELFKGLTPDEAQRYFRDPAAFNRRVGLEMARIRALALEPMPPDPDPTPTTD